MSLGTILSWVSAGHGYSLFWQPREGFGFHSLQQPAHISGWYCTPEANEWGQTTNGEICCVSKLSNWASSAPTPKPSAAYKQPLGLFTPCWLLFSLYLSYFTNSMLILLWDLFPFPSFCFFLLLSLPFLSYLVTSLIPFRYFQYNFIFCYFPQNFHSTFVFPFLSCPPCPVLFLLLPTNNLYFSHTTLH